MPEWINRKRRNWPTGSKKRALGGKSAVEALNDAIQNKNLVELIKDEDLALLLADRIIREMCHLGVSHSAGKSTRELNP